MVDFLNFCFIICHFCVNCLQSGNSNTTNTEPISNTVIILFVTDIDEMLHGVVTTIHSRGVKKEEADAQVKEELKTLVEEENTKLKIELKKERQKYKLVCM